MPLCLVLNRLMLELELKEDRLNAWECLYLPVDKRVVLPIGHCLRLFLQHAVYQPHAVGADACPPQVIEGFNGHLMRFRDLARLRTVFTH